MRSLCCALLAAALAVAAMPSSAPGAGMRKADHPFILWTKDELGAVRKRIETEPWAMASYERLLDHRYGQVKGLVRAVVTEDEALLAKEKQTLLGVARSPVPRGAAQWVTVLQYDLLHDRLSPEERAEVEKFFRTYIDLHVFKRAIFDPEVFNDSRNYSRYDAKRYTRSNWLPNITWPWKTSANLMAVALRDEALIRRTWAAYGSWKWYFDEYLGDIGFYEEEFSKMGSTPGAMVLYCEGLEALGLDELGYGYRGEGGATMRGHLEGLIHVTYAKVELHTARPRWPMVTMGDLRQSGSSAASDMPTPAFQHALVEGYLPDGTGGNTRWRAHGAWGGTKRGNNPQWDGYSGFTPKMQVPLWFELGHRRWPEAGFGYFLARMREPGQDRYVPSLFFGIEPLGPSDVAPPPAPSAVWPDRGLVMLRAEESPAYWTSPAPTVCMRLAANYAHHVNDSFTLLGLFAHHRPIYLNRQVTPGYARGWSRSVQAHAGVKVGTAEPGFTGAVTVRQAFLGPVKFAAARSGAVYPGVDLERGLLLTGEYLVDLVRLAADEPKDYHWFVHALGVFDPPEGRGWKDARFPEGLEQLADCRARDAGADGWGVRIDQRCALDDASKARLPKAWYDRRIGVHLRMLGEPGTTVYVARTPRPVVRYRDEDGDRVTREVPSEVGGRTVLAARQAPATVFAALHEPFERGQGRIASFEKLAATQRHVAARIVGKPGGGMRIDDRVLVALGDGPGEPRTVAGDGEGFTFADWAFVRVLPSRVEAHGDLRAVRVEVNGTPGLVLNGSETPARVEGGVLTWPAGR